MCRLPINITTFTIWSAFLAVLITLVEIKTLITGVTSRVAASIGSWSVFVPVIVNLGRNSVAPIIPPFCRICPEIIERFCHYYFLIHVVNLMSLKLLFGPVLESIHEVK